MQVVWYLAAVAMAGLALWPARRWSSPLICTLAAAFIAWALIGYPLAGVLGGHALRVVPLFGRGGNRDRADHLAGPRRAWQRVTAGLLFALMIAWSGHDNVLIGLAVVLLAPMLAQALTGHRRPPYACPIPPAQPGKLKVSARM